MPLYEQGNVRIHFSGDQAAMNTGSSCDEHWLYFRPLPSTFVPVDGSAGFATRRSANAGEW